MNRVDLGSAFRAVRLELRLRQSDVARRAGLSQQTVSRIERGAVGPVALDSLDAAALAIGANLSIALHWRGSALPRLLDRRHAELQDAVAGSLSEQGWDVRVEESFSHYGERGSVDILAWRPDRRALLIAEVKTELVDLQETIRILDMKTRLVPTLARRQHGWQPCSVGAVLFLPAATVNRSLVERHAALMSAALPARTREVARWLARPDGNLRGIAFVRYTHSASTALKGSPVKRVSKPRSRTRRAPASPDGHSERHSG